jgi:LuxR family transcriptional regulator, maltose regulon positive regulatory protein
MSTPILATKLYIPPAPPKVVVRPRLVERLNEGLHRKLTLISAPAGFGKTTLVSTWVAGCDRQVGWLSLDEGDNDPTRFLIYLVAAVRTIAPNIGEGVLGLLLDKTPQPPPTESILTTLLNEITTIPENAVLVIDDYHLIDAKPVDAALTFLLEHLPPQIRLVIATREDPRLPLARLRGGGQLSELRATDLRFTPSEAAGFLNHAMGLHLSEEDIATLETRTEGWIAGLQLAALSLQGHADTSSFIQSFTGSHHFVLDYLLEEVLQRQSERVQTFLLRTSILDHLCGSLCDAVLRDPSASGQATLEYLERANLFLVPLDNERGWYRYHHLFAELLRQRLHRGSTSSAADDARHVTELHRRASQWYEDHGLEIEAFHHAAAANDVDRAERLIEGHGVPLQFRGAAAPVLNWLESLPTTVLDARPSLWVTYATAVFFVGRHTSVEQKLQAAEAALRGTDPDDRTRDLVGRIAAIRATLAIIQHDVETIIAQSRRALEYLHPDNLPIRTAAFYTLGHAFQLQADRAAARQAYTEVISISKSLGDSIYTIAATIGLGQVQEADNQLFLAARTYRRVLELAGDPPRTIASEAHLGLARIYYEWNDLDAAQQHGQQCLQLTRQIESVDTFASYGVFLARLRLARGDVPGAVAILADAEQFLRQHNFVFRMPDVAAAQVLTLLRLGHLAAAAHLAETHELPISQARVYLAGGDTCAALTVLENRRQQVEAKGWPDERLEGMVLRAVALDAHGDRDKAVQLLFDALALAEPGGFVRSFVDEGVPMVDLLSAAAAHGRMPDYVERLLAVFEAGKQKSEDPSVRPPAQPLIEPLSQREVEVLRLIAQGLSNNEIGERLFLALDTVKGHNRKIFGKLQVQRRTEAVARARELGLS